MFSFSMQQFCFLCCVSNQDQGYRKRVARLPKTSAKIVKCNGATAVAQEVAPLSTYQKAEVKVEQKIQSLAKVSLTELF